MYQEENYSNQRLIFQQNLVKIPKPLLKQIEYRSNVAIVFTNKEKISMAGSGVMIAKDTIITAAHNIYSKEQNQEYDSFKVYLNPNNIAEEYFECQSWRYPQQFKTVSNNIKRLRYDYAIIKLKPNPRLEIKYNQFLSLSSPCPECLSIKSQQITLLLSGFPFNCGKNYTNLDVQAGKRIIINQYGQSGRDKIVNIDAGKCKIAYTISTQPAQSGCPIISNNSIIGIHSGSDDRKQCNVGRLIDDQLICNVEQWAKELNCQGKINTSVFLPQFCPHISNASEQIAADNTSDESQQNIESIQVNLNQNISQPRQQKQDQLHQMICFKANEEQHAEVATQASKHRQSNIQKDKLVQSQQKPPNIKDEEEVNLYWQDKITNQLQHSKATAILVNTESIIIPIYHFQIMNGKKFVKLVVKQKKSQDSEEMIFLENEDQSKWGFKKGLDCYCIRLKMAEDVQKKEDVKDQSKKQQIIQKDRNKYQQNPQAISQLNLSQKSIENSEIEIPGSSSDKKSLIFQQVKTKWKGPYLMKTFQGTGNRFHTNPCIQNQINLAKRLQRHRHKYIAQYFYVSYNDSFIIKMGLDYKHWKKLLPLYPQLVTKLMQDVCNGILELKGLKIYHGDLALRNIILYIDDQGTDQFDYLNFDSNKIMEQFSRLRFKLIDFGDAYQYQDDKIGQRLDNIINWWSKSNQLINSLHKYIKDNGYSREITIFNSYFDNEYQQFLRQIWSNLSQEDIIVKKFVERDQGEDMTLYLRRFLQILKYHND